MKTTRRLLFVFALVLLATLPSAPRTASADAPLGNSFVISNDSTLQELDPAVAYNSQGREYLVVWWNDRPGNDDIRAERVSVDGKQLASFWVNAGTGHDRRYPDVAYNVQTNQYLVVWEDYVQVASAYAIYGRLISATGQLISDEVIVGVTVNKPARPVVAYSSTSNKYLVVWQEQYTSGANTWVHIVGRVVNSDGSMYGAKFTISQDPGGQPRGQPQLVYNHRKNAYLVVWQQLVGSDRDIFARLVNGLGTVAPGIIIISSTLREETKPTVAVLPTATSVGEYMVVWQSDSPSDGVVKAQLVSGDGSLTGPSPIDLRPYGAGEYAISAVAGNDSSQRFLIVSKAGATSPFLAQTISGDLTKWSGWHPLDSGPGADQPAIASGPQGDFLAAFQRAPFGTQDIYGLLWGERVFLPLIRR